MSAPTLAARIDAIVNPKVVDNILGYAVLHQDYKQDSFTMYGQGFGDQPFPTIKEAEEYAVNLVDERAVHLVEVRFVKVVTR